MKEIVNVSGQIISSIYKLKVCPYLKQGSIPVGCALQACADNTSFNSHQMLALVRCPEVNKFEQVSSVTSRGSPWSHVHGGGPWSHA